LNLRIIARDIGLAAEEKIEKICNAFEQGRPSSPDGLGGLDRSWIKALIDAHGGKKPRGKSRGKIWAQVFAGTKHRGPAGRQRRREKKVNRQPERGSWPLQE